MAIRKPHQPPTHLKLIFARSTWMRKDHVAGPEGKGEDESALMFIVPKGEARLVVYGEARHLIVAESAVEDLADNKDRIAEIRESAVEDKKRQIAYIREQEQAKLSKVESLDEKIVRIAREVGTHIAQAIGGGRKAA